MVEDIIPDPADSWGSARPCALPDHVDCNAKKILIYERSQ